jgi:hypothetical protein
MREEIEKAIKMLALKAANAVNEREAVEYSQAVSNLAYALNTLKK